MSQRNKESNNRSIKKHETLKPTDAAKSKCNQG